MSSDESESGGTGPIEIDDPEDYNAGRRLRQIHNARERFPELVRDEAERASSGDITEDRYLEIVSEAIVWYLVELEPIMTSEKILETIDEDGDLDQYWSGKYVDEAEEITLETIVEEFGDIDDEPLTRRQALRAYRIANTFMNRTGFGLSFDEGLPTIRGYDTSRDDPDGEVSKVQYSGSPDL